MNEAITPIPTRDGTMPTFVTRPSARGPYPAVIVYMDIWGLREELFDIARRVATVGYCVLVPDLYYRLGRVRNAFRDAQNRMLSFDRLDAVQREQVRAPSLHLSDALVIEDTRAMLRHLDGDEAVRRGGVGCIGYCMGGRFALQVAGAFPDRFVAAASLHGTNLVTDAADSPHLAAKRARGELYCGFGEKDKFAAPGIVAKLAETLREGPVRYQCEVHRGAEHGYALPDRDIHDKAAANRDWEIIFGMFHRRIVPFVAGETDA